MGLWASLVLGEWLTDINAQPKLFPASLLEAARRMPSGFEWDVYLCHRALQAGLQIRTIPVVFGERAHGQSRWAATFFSRWRTILRVARYIVKLRFSGERP
jgi:hypothetical protein